MTFATMHRPEWGVSPAHAIVVVLLFCAGVAGWSTYLLTQQPWIGVRLEPDVLSGAMRVAAVDAASPAVGRVEVGQVMAALQVDDAQPPIPLTPALFLSPFFSPTHADYQAYLQHQGEMFAALSAGRSVRLIDAGGKAYSLAAQSQTPWRAIPASFWAFSLLFMVIPVISVLVWSYQPRKLAAVALLFAGIGQYLFYTIGMLNIGKELAYRAELAEWLAISELFCMNVYTHAFTWLFAFYPHALLRKSWLYGFALWQLFFLLNFHFGWLDFYGHNFLWPSFSAFVFAVVLSQMQIARSRQSPVLKVTARIMQASILFPFFPVMLFYVLPLVLYREPLIGVQVVNGLGVVVFIGLAIGILRYRLFDAEYWWFKSWLWLLGGALVVLIDLVLVGVLRMTGWYSLGLSVLVAGFLYFPLRQWLLGKLMPLEGQSVQDFLPAFSALMGGAVSRDGFEQCWREALRTRFQPLHLTAQPTVLHSAVLVDNGLHLDVPALYGHGSVRLTGRQMGSRLFGKDSLKMVASLLDIAHIASHASEIRQQLVLKERTRIMHDLHDTVGAKLLTLIHTLPERKHQQAAQESLQILRDIISLTLQKTPVLLGDYLADWRAEVMERAEAANVQVVWQADPMLEGLELRPAQLVELLLFFREALAALFADAALARLEIHFIRQDGQLTAHISNPASLPMTRACSLCFT
ncbi:hypothetical protein VSS37_13190 [Candidatus Thiothrix sp. Deng01]|uniref:Signal transduction histidine kinase subgroup 3 dimerisation and phosphoacceptor domain-containing protein n=1 Tax=Candidatus Thiothrix phosphatis TaxID=3112415 RepID=A0ABU6CYM4_9GAMM|nr:hypothetical protein [Candidatus Thiothrix sp. Deng01]MEB4591941.1 hypothetical protein [Candidatus Thiothrix sp. Deng01]